MGKKKGGGKKGRASSGGPKALDVYDDDERQGLVGSGLGGDAMYDDMVDAVDLAEDADLSRALEKAAAVKMQRRRGEDPRFEDVFAVSDQDDDDEPLPKSLLQQQESDLEDQETGNQDEDGLGNWGSKKRYFYGGNPNDPAQKKDGTDKDNGELDEAEAEAEEGKAIQLKQLQELDEEDFFDTFGATDPEKADEKLAGVSGSEGIELDLSKLNKKEKVQLFHRESPEFKGIMSDFEEKVEEASNRLQPILDLINEGHLPDNNQAAKYVRTKHQLILNYCANVSAFLMFKTQRSNLKFHPITTRLVQFKQLLDKMKPLDEAMQPELDKVLKVVAKHDSDSKKVTKALKKMSIKHNAPREEKSKVEAKPASKKRKRLQILSGNAEVSQLPQQESLTLDEEKALELFEALKSKRAKLVKQHKEETRDDSTDDEDETPAPHADNVDAEALEDGEDDERRGITYQIAKNKGLQPKRSKLQRNPRVKHRHKFEKAKIRRKGQVREVRKEVKKYTGELTGINARVKKGVKIM